MSRSYSSQRHEQDSAQRHEQDSAQHPVRLPSSTQIQLVNKLDCVVTHAEVNITLCSYMLKAVAEGAQTICILSDNTDIFVLLVYWMSRMWIIAKIKKVGWRCPGHQRNHRTVRHKKVQPASRCPHAIWLQYGVIHLWKRKAVGTQYLEMIYQVSMKCLDSLARPMISSRQQQIPSSL